MTSPHWNQWLNDKLSNSAFDSLSALTVKFRAMQLFAHIGHNLVSGQNFKEDHEFLGELYETYEGVYDSLVERMIGLGTDPDLFEITNAANDMLQNVLYIDNASNDDWFSSLLDSEKSVCAIIQGAMRETFTDTTEATKNLLAQIADDSEQRQYKMQQRIDL